MKTKETATMNERSLLKSSLHYIGLGVVYALGLFVVLLQLRSLL